MVRVSRTMIDHPNNARGGYRILTRGKERGLLIYMLLLVSRSTH